MNTKVYIPDIECESCVKLLNRKFSDVKGIESVKINNDSADIQFDHYLIGPEHLVKLVKESGFRASLEPFERKTLSERIRDFRENRKKYELEIVGLKYVIYVFLALAAVEAVAYFGFLSSTSNFLSKYGLMLFYLNFTIALMGGATWHFIAYKARVTCMTGMMIGMIFGMQAGMMLGAILGATNGFFIGAVAGMMLGVIVGVLTGKCCGTMGVLQGMMAGMMGGTMGPMISVMMISDNLNLFLPLYMTINAIIVIGLSFIVIEEIAEGKQVTKEPLDFATFASACLIITTILVAIMVFGPKSAVAF